MDAITGLDDYCITKTGKNYEYFMEYYAVNKKTNDNVVIKKYNSNLEGINEFAKYNSIILTENKAVRNIAKIVEYKEIDNVCYLIEECHNYSFDEYFKRDKNEIISEDKIKKFLLELCTVLLPFHIQYLSHGNLQPSSINFNKNGDLILDHFTRLRFKNNPYIINSMYTCPEQLILDNDTSTYNDIWSIGVLLYQICSGIPPFKGYIDVIKFTESEECNPKDLSDKYSYKLRELIEECLEIEEEDRPNLEEIIETFLNNK